MTDDTKSPTIPAIQEATHRHKKRGSEYALLGFGKMQAEGWFEAEGPDLGCPIDMRLVAIYRSVDDGSLWVRPKEEFEDGRFEALPAAPSPADNGDDPETSEGEDMAWHFIDRYAAGIDATPQFNRIRSALVPATSVAEPSEAMQKLISGAEYKGAMHPNSWEVVKIHVDDWRAIKEALASRTPPVPPAPVGERDKALEEIVRHAETLLDCTTPVDGKSYYHGWQELREALASSKPTKEGE